MSVEIQVEFQISELMLLHNGSFGCIDCWVLLLGRLYIHPVEINEFGVKTVVASRNAVYVENRNYFKHKSL